MGLPAANQQGEKPIEAVLLGTAVGDALGLPREGLSRRRANRLFGGPPLHHALIGRLGMTSDDTEHACLTAQALAVAGGDEDCFARSLGWKLRFWFLALPPGIGMATAKACIKLLIGFPPTRSGVFSAGNGPAMRAATIGVYARNDVAQLKRLIHLSTRVTHTDPAAEQGALAIALAAMFSVNTTRETFDSSAFVELLRIHMADAPLLNSLERTVTEANADTTFESYLSSLRLQNGISGYINHTVPPVMFCWIRWRNDFRQAVEQIILAGGDADTTAAITGGACFANGGVGIDSGGVACRRQRVATIEEVDAIACRIA